MERRLRGEIARSGPGTRLPSVRALVREHRVSPLTVQRVLDRLGREGLVDARPGVGTFVLRPPERATGDTGWQQVVLGSAPGTTARLEQLLEPAPGGVRSLVSGYPDPSLHPAAALAAAAGRAARRPGAWDRVPSGGVGALREWFAAELAAGTRAEDTLVVSGGQAALSAIFRTVAPPGSPVLLESPTYVGALDAARQAGLVPVPVPTDHDGVRPDLLAEAFRRTGARLAYLQPLHANPTAAVLAPARRQPVLEVLAAAGALAIEDDFARDLTFGDTVPRPLLADDTDGHVVHIRSLTKSAAPGLRIAAVSGRGPVMRRLRTMRVVEDFFVSGLLQETALELVTAPGWPRHVAGLRRAIAARMDVALAAIAAWDTAPVLGRRPGGGVSLWVGLPDGVDEAAVVGAAARRGVAVGPGVPWFVAEPTGPHLRLSVARLAGEELREAVAEVGRAVAEVAAGSAG